MSGSAASTCGRRLAEAAQLARRAGGRPRRSPRARRACSSRRRRTARACSGQTTNSDVAPSGHQFGLHCRGAGPAEHARAAPASCAVVGDRQRRVGAISVTIECSRAKPRSTYSGSHGLLSSSSAMQKPSLPGWPSVARSRPPGRAAAGERDHAGAARGRWSGWRASRARARPCPRVRPIASRTGPLTTTSWPAASRHRLAVEVEGRVERRLARREHDREVRRAGSRRAPRRRPRARASPRPCRAAPRRATRCGSRPPSIAVDALAASAARRAARRSSRARTCPRCSSGRRRPRSARSSRRRTSTSRRSRASCAAARRSGRGADAPAGWPTQHRSSASASQPTDAPATDASRVDEDRRRHAVEVVGARRVVGRRLGQHRDVEARVRARRGRRPRAGPRRRPPRATPVVAQRPDDGPGGAGRGATSGTPRRRRSQAPVRRRRGRRVRPNRRLCWAARTTGRGCRTPGRPRWAHGTAATRERRRPPAARQADARPEREGHKR